MPDGSQTDALTIPEGISQLCRWQVADGVLHQGMPEVRRRSGDMGLDTLFVLCPVPDPVPIQTTATR